MERRRAFITVLITEEMSTLIPVSKLKMETVTRINSGKIDEESQHRAQ
jgi:hypothetical protein